MVDQEKQVRDAGELFALYAPEIWESDDLLPSLVEVQALLEAQRTNRLVLGTFPPETLLSVIFGLQETGLCSLMLARNYANRILELQKRIEDLEVIAAETNEW